MSNNNAKILSEPISYQEFLLIKDDKRLNIAGIYKIENIITHKVYIGQSKNIIVRLKDHISYETNRHLKNAFKKYGFNNFSFEILKETYDLNYWEIFLIKAYKANNEKYGYNIAAGGQGGDHGPEANKKRSITLKGKTSWAKGKHFSKEHKEKLRLSNLGKKRSEESIKHNSEARKRYYVTHGPTKGSKGMHWFHNESESIFAYNCPDGYVPGRLPFDKNK